jgi:predicted DNA-binding transcriptional regulator YafY
MPINKEALIRYRVIDLCLRNKYRKYPSMDDLMEALEDKLGKTFSLSTIQKDIKAMKEDPALGYLAPIGFSRVHNGYYYKDEHYTIASVSLNSEDWGAIDFAGEILQQFRDIPIFRQYVNTVEKIKEAIFMTQALDGYHEDPFIQFEQVTDFKGRQWLATLVEAIKERKVIEIKHQKFGSDDSKAYTLHPYLLKEYRNRWYLIGMLKDDGDIRTFGLDRILDVQWTDYLFQWHTTFATEDYFKYSFGISTGMGEPVEIVLSFTPLAGQYITSQPIHHSQKVLVNNEKECRISIRVIPSVELKMQILGYGSDCKVISPAHFAEEIKNTIQSMLDNYDY